ncbi:hypothetical protein [Nocardioides stalactiti]|uniref:hypothetical protein n=1 Tax=Nocardioides stalactiti TaxID=2755356 RepID=UPI0016036A1E|nr:hypothetical protein [Nocardioides stalactiti]
MRALGAAAALLAVTTVVAGLTGCSTDRDTDPAAPPTLTTGSTPTATPTRTADAPPTTGWRADEVTDCGDLLATGWEPPATEPQLGYDPQSGLVTLYLPGRDLVLDLLRDRACRRLPFYGPILVRTLKEADSVAD